MQDNMEEPTAALVRPLGSGFEIAGGRYGVMLDRPTWRYIRWSFKEHDETLRVSIADCLRFIDVKRSEMPNPNRLIGIFGRQVVLTRVVPLDDDNDGKTIVCITIPRDQLPRLLIALKEPVRLRVEANVPSLSEFIQDKMKDMPFFVSKGLV
jgi:hypothetical protein